ncbi:unnamed protein product [Rhizophagus irregularis]|nr:unnamed protein product [Rhizophagus irregularis]
MSSLLGLAVRFSRPVPHIFRPTVFFSSTARLFNKSLMMRNLVQEMLKDKGLPIINTTSSFFTREDVEALKVSFQPVTSSSLIISPDDVSNDFPEQYVQPDINQEKLDIQNFDIRKFDGIYDNDVRTFILKLHWVVKNATVITGTNETYTDTLVDDLLRIVGLNTFPLVIRNHQVCRLFIGGYPYMFANPEYSIKMIDTSMIAVEDKHLENISFLKGFGEWQIVAEILAFGDENMRRVQARDQTVYVVRIISKYVTFYKAMIPAPYFAELGDGLPQKESVVILRWPGESMPEAGLNIAEPEGRREVLEVLTRIRQHLLNGN